MGFFAAVAMAREIVGLGEEVVTLVRCVMNLTRDPDERVRMRAYIVKREQAAGRAAHAASKMAGPDHE